jgi:hypothetical protein
MLRSAATIFAPSAATAIKINKTVVNATLLVIMQLSFTKCF